MEKEEEKELFYSKNNHFYRTSQESIREWVENSDNQPYFQEIAKRRFEEYPSFGKVFIMPLLDPYIDAVAKAATETGQELRDKPVRTLIKAARGR